MEIEVHLEVLETIRSRLRAVKNTYDAQAGSGEYAQIEELALEAFQSLKRAAKNMVTMVELERQMNEQARKLQTGPEITACQKLLKAVADLPGIPN